MKPKSASADLGIRQRLESAKREMISELLKSLNSTSQSARKSWLFFISLMAYLFVAVASVNHSDLLLNTPLKLPLLQIEVSLAGFFLFAPILFILAHFGVLLHQTILERKAKALNEALAYSEKNSSRSNQIRLQVSSYFISQKLAGPRSGKLLSVLLSAMDWLTLELLPLMLTVYFLVCYLPVHDHVVTSVHKLYVVIDVGVLIALLIVRYSTITQSHNLIPRLFATTGRAIAWLCIVSFAILVATLPTANDEQAEGRNFEIDQRMTSLWPTKLPFDWYNQKCERARRDRCAFWLTAAIFEQPIDFISGRAGWLSRNLVVTDKDVLASSRTPQKETSSLNLRGRDLRYATLNRSNLRGIDITASDLTGASMIGVDLTDATFGCAVKGKKVVTYGGTKPESVDDEFCTNLEGANLTEAKLTNRCSSCFNRANLSGVTLARVDLRGFDLKGIRIPNGNLSRSILRGANLVVPHQRLSPPSSSALAGFRRL